MGLFDHLGGGTPGTISPEEAKRRMEAGGVTVLDVREPDEYADGHIPGAMLLPLGEVRAHAPRLLPDKNAELLVYCQSGARSMTACSILRRMGYTKVYDLGGMAQWPYEIEG